MIWFCIVLSHIRINWAVNWQLDLLAVLINLLFSILRKRHGRDVLWCFVKLDIVLCVTVYGKHDKGGVAAKNSVSGISNICHRKRGTGPEVPAPLSNRVVNSCAVLSPIKLHRIKLRRFRRNGENRPVGFPFRSLLQTRWKRIFRGVRVRKLFFSLAGTGEGSKWLNCSDGA